MFCEHRSNVGRVDSATGPNADGASCIHDIDDIRGRDQCHERNHG